MIGLYKREHSAKVSKMSLFDCSFRVYSCHRLSLRYHFDVSDYKNHSVVFALSPLHIQSQFSHVGCLVGWHSNTTRHTTACGNNVICRQPVTRALASCLLIKWPAIDRGENVKGCLASKFYLHITHKSLRVVSECRVNFKCHAWSNAGYPPESIESYFTREQM